MPIPSADGGCFWEERWFALVLNSERYAELTAAAQELRVPPGIDLPNRDWNAVRRFAQGVLGRRSATVVV